MDRRYLNTGFTLLELMVVVVIIAIMAAAISINITGEDPQKRIDNIGDDLYRRMLLAADTALLSGSPIGLQIERRESEKGGFQWQYSWYHYVKDRWQVADDPLTVITLPANVGLTLSVEGEPIEDFTKAVSGTSPALGNIKVGNTKESSAEESSADFDSIRKTVRPEIVIYPSGEITDFALQLSYRAESTEAAFYQISVDETGQLKTGGGYVKQY